MKRDQRELLGENDRGVAEEIGAVPLDPYSPGNPIDPYAQRDGAAAAKRLAATAAAASATQCGAAGASPWFAGFMLIAVVFLFYVAFRKRRP